ncbi:MAG TPA: hypothetical protein VFF32_11805 [Dermatophilaceae bacterium]|nr:hypothetical protein [Dermatophilaceae bacterium]
MAGPPQRVLLGGALFGVIGALVAIPIAAAVQLIVGRWPSRAWTAPDGHLLSGPASACEHRIMRYAMIFGRVIFPTRWPPRRCVVRRNKRCQQQCVAKASGICPSTIRVAG